MKKLFLSLTGAALMSVALVSCDKTPDVAGTWKINPQTFSMKDVSLASSTDCVTMTPDAESGKKGKIVINSTVAIDANASIAPMAPVYRVEITTPVSVEGTWMFSDSDDDDIICNLDMSTMSVDVKAENLEFAPVGPLSVKQDDIDRLRPYVISTYQTSLTKEMALYYTRYNKLEDVKVRDNALTCEMHISDIAGDKDMVWTKE